MFELPSKFTGIDCKLLDFGEFKKLCFSLQGLGTLKVRNIRGHEYAENYYEAIVEDKTGEFSFLQNCYIPYICFRRKSEDTICYFDKPNVVESLLELESDMIVLDVKTLNTCVSAVNLRSLGKYEINEVKSWLPETIGGLLFSWYFD